MTWELCGRVDPFGLTMFFMNCEFVSQRMIFSHVIYKYQFWYLYKIKSKVVDENQFIKCLFIALDGLKMIEIIVHKPYSFWFRINLYEPFSLLNDN